MTTWHYENGQWAETTFLDDAWQGEGETDWAAIRKRLGYEHYLGIGHSLSPFSINIYARTEQPRYVVEISDLNIWDAMTTTTLPAALDLLARYAPIVTAAEISCAIADIHDMDSLGIVTDIMAGIEVNRGAAANRAAQERQERQEARRRRQQRKAQP